MNLLSTALLAVSALELNEVLDSVNQHHPTIAGALADREGAVGEMLAADGAFDPVFRANAGVIPLGEYPHRRVDVSVEQPTPLFGTTFFGGYRVGNGSFAPYDGKRETNALGEVRAGVMVPLGRNGWTDRRRAGMERAALGVSASELAVQATRIEHTRLAAHRYWAWVAAGARVRAVEDLLQIAQTRDGQLRVRVERGDVAEFERVENERALQQRRSALVAARRALMQAAIELSLFLRDALGEPRIPDVRLLPPRLPDPLLQTSGPLTDLVDDALRARPDVARLEAQRLQQKIEVDLAHNQLLPAFDVVVQGSQDLGAGKPARVRPELEVLLTVEIPIPARTARGRLQTAEAATRRTGEQLRLQRDRVSAEVKDAHNAMSAARERIHVVRAEVSAARELEAMERKRFELGEGTLLFVNLRETSTVEAVLREVDAIQDFHRASADFLAARGGLRSANHE